MKDYKSIVDPLTKLLHKDAFKWDDQATEAFNSLKNTMVTLPTLALPNFDFPFMIVTDALGFGLRVVLMQGERPIAYFSQTLSMHAQRESIYKRELMAMVLLVQKWSHYLLGRKFTVISDQKCNHNSRNG